MTSDGPPPTNAKERALAAVAGRPSLVRADVHREVTFVGVAGVVVAVGLFFWFHGPAHAAGRPPWFAAAATLVWTGAATLATSTAWRHGTRPTHAAARRLETVCLATPSLLLLFHGAVVCFVPALATLHAERVGFKCLGLTLAAALIPLVGLALVRRASDPVHPVASGAALGVAAATFAGVMVIVWCPVAAPTHIFIGHVLPLLVCGAAGAVLGARVVAMRSTRSTRSTV